MTYSSEDIDALNEHYECIDEHHIYNMNAREQNFLTSIDNGFYGPNISRLTFFSYKNYKDNVFFDYNQDPKDHSKFDHWVATMIEAGFPCTDEISIEYENIYEDYYFCLDGIISFTSNSHPVKSGQGLKRRRAGFLSSNL